MNKKRWLSLLVSVVLVCMTLGFPFDVSAEEKVKIFSKTIEGYLKEYTDACWFCKAFEGLYDAINTLTTTLFNNLSQSFLNLMGVGILFLILFKVGKMLIQLQDVDIRQFLNDLFKPLGRAIIATALLVVTVTANSQNIFYIITNPFIEASLRISEQIVSSSLKEVKYLKTDSSGSSVSRTSFGSVDFTEVNNEYKTENNNPPSKAMGEANKKMLVAWLKKVSSSFIVGIAMGGTFVKIGIRGTNFFTKGVPVAIAGATLWIGFWLIYLFFPIRLLNAFVRIAFVFALMPLWIVLWVFPPTQQYTKKAWEMFLSSCLVFVALSVLVSLALLLVDQVVPENLWNEGSSITRDQFFNKLIAGEDEEAKKYAGWGSGLILNCIAFTLLGWSMMEKAEIFANSFIGGAGNIQLNVGNQTAATVAKGGKVVMSGAKMTANVALWGGKKVGGKILQKVKGKFGGSGSSGSGDGGSGSRGSGGGAGGGGGTPPPSKPTVVPGPKGETGDKGPQGDPAKPGTMPPEGTSLHDVPKPEGTDVRETVRPAEMPTPEVAPSTSEAGRRAATRENELYEMQGNPEAKNALLASVGANERRALIGMDMAIQRGEDLTPHRQALKEGIMADMRRASASGSDARATLAGLSPERLRAVQDLAKDGGKASQLQKLSQDVAFVESSLGMKHDDFDRAMKEHKWQTDGKAMQDFASDAYLYKGKPTLMAVATNRLLKNTSMSSTATMHEASQISERAGRALAERTSNALSGELNTLADQVSAAEVVKQLPKA